MANGGLMQLVAYGAQDVYLTGNPQITYFKVVYRRHTNFSVETIEQSIDSARPDNRYTVRVPRNGDLATNSCLKVRLAQVTKGELSGVDEIAWVRRLGHAMIRQVRVDIGGTTIDTHAGTWLDIWYELTHKDNQERGYRKMIGDVPELTELKTVADAATAYTSVLPEYTVYVPFQFWFCRNTGLALPLIALQYHEVSFQVELENITKLLVWRGASAPALSSYNYRNASVMIDYVYLDSEERRKFAQVGHEYLIEEVQSNSGGETLSGTVSAAGDALANKFKLGFNHPCKEIVWALKVGAFSGESLGNSFDGGNTFLCYTHGDDSRDWADAVNDAVKGLAESCVKVSTNDTDDTPNTVTFLENGAGTVARVGKYNVTMVEAAGGDGNADLYMDTGLLLGNSSFNFHDGIESADIVVNFTAAARDSNGDITTVAVIDRVECTHVSHNVSLNDLSIPVSNWATDNRGSDGVHNKRAVHVVQPHNYGLSLDGSGNSTATAKLELNSHARFEEQEGSYFNYVQTRAHTHTPADGVNVFAFGLHPENHQPSGTANLSRIDNTYLIVTFTDELRPKGSNLLNWTSASKLYIFAVNYNVLRCMSGMAGKAYSN